MSLKDRLRAEIAAAGPISVAEFMTRCLHDPKGGYYATRPAIGEAGDFITAPQVSQMFGELIGLWLVETWRRIGAPARMILAEAGPGDGTLIGDIVRAARLEPAFLAASELWLIETSEPLRRLQAERLAPLGVAPRWASSPDELPTDAPLLLAANEFLDCLPARQFQKVAEGWAERLVGVTDDGALAIGLGPPSGMSGLPEAPVGTVLERSAAQEAFGEMLGSRIAAQGGAGLLIDYGRDERAPGDTLQALVRHQQVDPLADPGAADLTVHADFPAVLAAARRAGCETALLAQGDFLRRLGVEARADALARSRPDRAASIGRQLRRLVDADQMGALFKAAAVWVGPAPPGFEETR
jgi:SAM-dependent MidA family methyltransferase